MYMEILKMDIDSLYDLSFKGIDTSKFIIQKDLDDYFEMIMLRNTN